MLKKERNITKTETIFLSVGVDWERKNMHKSIKVIEKLNLLNMKSKIIIVGSIPPEYEIPDYVKIIPFLNKNNKREKIFYIICIQKVIISFLSKAEAFGIVINEASCYGLPVITSNIDGLKYVADKNILFLIIKIYHQEIANKTYLINKGLTNTTDYNNSIYPH